MFARFDHFEKLADIQMLAMLACIFSEPATQEGVSNALMGSKQEVSQCFPSVQYQLWSVVIEEGDCVKPKWMFLTCTPVFTITIAPRKLFVLVYV